MKNRFSVATNLAVQWPSVSEVQLQPLVRQISYETTGISGKEDFLLGYSGTQSSLPEILVVSS